MLQTSKNAESGFIVPSQKNSGNRSCTLANNEIANNSKMSCSKIMNKAAKNYKKAPIELCLKEIKYAAKDNKDVPFFHHSSKLWAILVLVFSCSIL